MEKYFLLGSLDEILAKLSPHSGQPATGKKVLGNSLDIKIEDGLIWISIESIEKKFGWPLSKWLMEDGMLDAMNKWQKEIGVFPIQEM